MGGLSLGLSECPWTGGSFAGSLVSETGFSSTEFPNCFYSDYSKQQQWQPF